MSSARLAPALASPPDEEERANILVVDDHPGNLLAIEAILEPLGQQVVKATSGGRALERLLVEEFAVILMDVQMPGLDGTQTARLIKEREKTRHVPIIFLTAISREEAHVFRGYSAGAVDYLLKPFDPDILRCKVQVFVELWLRGRRLERREALLRHRERELHEDTFIAAASHELRTPIAAAKATAQLALRRLGHDRDAPATRSLETLASQIDRIAKLVEDLLDVSRVRIGRLGLELGPFDLVDLVRDAVERMQLLTEAHTLGVAAPASLEIVGDRARVEQVVTNLIANAIRYSPGGGAIQVTLRQEGSHVRLSVRDRGVGIPREAQATIFERFGRAHGARFGGFGLGLTIARGIVAQHDGEISVESTGVPGEGTSFHVRLPKVARVGG